MNFSLSSERALQAYRWALAALLIAYAVFIGANFAPVAAGADSGGYMLSARLITEGKLTDEMRRIPEFTPPTSWLHTPLGYLDSKNDGALRPTYPVGLPLHYAAAASVAGWHWGVLGIGVLAACGAVVACYLCAIELGLGRSWALASAVALGVSPVFLFTSFIPMSDTPATAWCGFALWCALRARRAGAGWAVGCGMAFAVAVLVRPSNVIFCPVLLVALGSWKNLLCFGLGGFPAAVFNGVYNYLLYGKATESGYGPIFGIFRWEYVAASFKNYGETLPRALPLVFGIGLGCWFLPWKTQWRELTALLLWALIFFVFYAFYEFTHYTWWYLRFVLPAFPAVVLLGAWSLHAIVTRWAPAARLGRFEWAAAILLIVASTWGAVNLGRETHVMLMKSYQLPYVAVGEWTKKNIPANSLVMCMQTSSAIHFYTDFAILRYDALDPDPRAQLKEGLLKSGRPFYAALLPHEEEEALGKRFPGNWEKVSNLKDVNVWRYQPTP